MGQPLSRVSWSANNRSSELSDSSSSLGSDCESNEELNESQELRSVLSEAHQASLEVLADDCMKREAFLQVAQLYGIQDEYLSQDLPMEESTIEDDYYSLDEKSQETSVRAAGRANLATANGEAVSRNGARLKWQRGALLGSGSFGRVYLGLNLLTGGFMAVKQVELLEDQIAQHRAEVAALQNEISVLQTLKHANIVQYLGSSVEGSCLNIFLEYVPGGSISSLIKKFGSDEGLPETLVRYYTKQILSGLQYLHSNQIIHRDIKGANILVDDKGVIKLADFGASKKIEEIVAQVGVGDSIASLKGTVYWMAPEVIKQTGYGRQADIWSVGCTVIEMATGLPPWSAEYTDQVSALFTIATSNEMPSLPGDFSEEGKDFLAQCFRRNPKERPNATKLLQHPWLSTPSVPLNPKRLSSSQRSRPESLNLSTSMSRFSGSFSDDYSGSPRSEPSLTPNASSLMRDFSFKDSPESTAYGSLSSQPAT